MARASTRTLLPLDRFAALIGMHPLHFNQVQVDDIAEAATCGQPLVQYAWQQSDAIGREEIAEAIAEAESELADHLGFSVLPDWVVDERVDFTRPSAPNLFNKNNTDIRGMLQSLRASRRMVIAGGIEAKSVIQAGVAIVYSDSDGDGYDETATITVATTVTDPEEIAAYYPGESGDEAWEIRPISVLIAGGNATITCRREQLVIPDLMEGLTARAADGLIDANFLDEVDVYRHYHDPSQQIQFMWEAIPNSCDCGDAECLTCTISTQYGCLIVRSARLGLVVPQPGTWNGTDYDSAEFSVYRQPERARLWYRAGWRWTKSSTPHLRMDPMWERAVARLALSKLDRQICACASMEAFAKYWQEDLAAEISTTPQSSSFKLSDRILDNPLGTTRGAVYAWRLISKHAVSEGVGNA